MSVAHDRDAFETDPATWGPEWDNWFWECDDTTPDPTPADEEWAARELNPDVPTDDQVDAMAAEAAALDRLERSLIPPDVVDILLHMGSNPNLCICRGCIMRRTERFAGDDA